MFRLFLVSCCFVIVVSCKDKNPRFTLMSSAESGISFNNQIIDSDTLNVLDVENIYNGGGVGVADFNNDGLTDIYFTGNTVPNKLYLNKGNLSFADITDAAGVTGEGRWARGVAVVDINQDGLMDLYVCASLSPDSRKRENILYINSGLNKDGVPVFRNMAVEYGLADTSHSTMAAFFDYDNDGDLDMYLLNNEIVKHEFTNNFRKQLVNGEHPGTDKLYRNDWNAALGHPVYTNVSAEAGILTEGYGHGVNIADINLDGFKDVYVTNDFVSENILYINQGNGTFKNEIKNYLKHTAENAMGQDVTDINNDGLADIIELDMNPENNYRKKMMMNSMGYQRYVNNEYYNYQFQYVRNVLQINQGPRMLANDSIGAPAFSDISFYSGIAETDWSWTPSVADYDNDGFRDIVVTNGFPRDVTDHDFMAFRNKASSLSSKKEILTQIPEVKISNYAYHNNGDLTFTDVTSDWGLKTPSFSNGAAYADLDNDGDLEFIVNNINDKAMVYRNNTREDQKEAANFLQVRFAGDSSNRNGIGSIVEIYYDSAKKQVYENTPYRGYLSSIMPYAHFGLGSIKSVDSLVIHWTNGRREIVRNVASNMVFVAEIKNSVPDSMVNPAQVKPLFTDITSQTGLTYVHEDRDFVDFNIQNLLPHKLSQYGPALAVGDLDGNGYDDLVAGGSFFYSAQIFFQDAMGRFRQESLSSAQQDDSKRAEDMGLLLFDADGDGDLDLYVARGGYESPAKGLGYQDVLYVNKGNGQFYKDPLAIPENLTSNSCVRAADFDRDGDLDLFVAGRVEPARYPVAVSSKIYRNDSKDGSITFTDITSQKAPALENVGMICDALFTDFDNDGWQDLILAGEWMPLTFLKNVNGRFENVSESSGADGMSGWWNSLAAGDFDNDGDMDYVAGNFGTNSFYKATSQYPVFITAKDFDNNGSFDAIPSLYLPSSFEKPARQEYPADLRDDMIKQIVSTRARFRTYKEYADATMQQLLTAEQMNGALRLKATELRSYYLSNDGQGKFTFTLLPAQAQISIINGMVTEDFDGDGNLDLAIAGNDFGTGLNIGRYDAANGLMLKGDGKGNFKTMSILQSGIYLPGNTKALVKLKGSTGKMLLAASENKGPLKMLAMRDSSTFLPLGLLDLGGVVRFRDGTSRKWEQGYGYSFLSQSGRFLSLGRNVKSVTITNTKGASRTVTIP